MDPAAPIPNYDNPESIGYRLVIVAVVFPVLALCFLVPRLYTASHIIRKWHPDDCEISLHTNHTPTQFADLGDG